MFLIKELGHKPVGLTVASKYTVLNGIGYLVVGAILIFSRPSSENLSSSDMRKRLCA